MITMCESIENHNTEIHRSYASIRRFVFSAIEKIVSKTCVCTVHIDIDRFCGRRTYFMSNARTKYSNVYRHHKTAFKF